MIKKMIVILLIFLAYNCKEKREFTLFDINPNVTPKSLLKNGFERVQGVDVFLFQKQAKDTLYSFQFDNYDARPHSQWWEVKVDALSATVLDQVITPYNCSILSECVDSDEYYIMNFDNSAIINVSNIEEEDKLLFTYIFQHDVYKK